MINTLIPLESHCISLFAWLLQVKIKQEVLNFTGTEKGLYCKLISTRMVLISFLLYKQLKRVTQLHILARQMS